MRHLPRVESDPDILESFLSDAAHMPGGFAAGVTFPRSNAEVAAIVSTAKAVLPVGAQSSLTGGATPRGEIVVSTRRLDAIAIDPAKRLAHVGAGVPLRALQNALAAEHLWYPPAPTYDGAFVGGTISTNAAGAATFKYGSTRDWVEGLTIVLASGQVLTLKRGDVTAAGRLLNVVADAPVTIPVPGYVMPAVGKLSAGYFARPDMDLLDLMVGSEGTLGVIVEATLRVIPRPLRAVALIQCADDDEVVSVTLGLRERARRAWRGEEGLDVSAIEFMDAKSLAFVADSVFARAGLSRPTGSEALLLAQIEVGDNIDHAVEALSETLSALSVATDPVVALPGDDSAAASLFELRESVPAGVNAAIAEAKRTAAAVHKTAGDFIVPINRLADSIALYRRVCASHQVSCALWGHVSDGNLHPNIIPRSADEMQRGQLALLEMATGVIDLGGAPLAEHGVGRSPIKQQMLGMLYGETGVEEMRAVKRALDPTWKLSPGVLFTP